MQLRNTDNNVLLVVFKSCIVFKRHNVISPEISSINFAVVWTVVDKIHNVVTISILLTNVAFAITVYKIKVRHQCPNP
jgi:hypothetical protein